VGVPSALKRPPKEPSTSSFPAPVKIRMAEAVSEEALGRTGTTERVYCDDYLLSPHRSRFRFLRHSHGGTLTHKSPTPADQGGQGPCLLRPAGLSCCLAPFLGRSEILMMHGRLLLIAMLAMLLLNACYFAKRELAAPRGGELKGICWF